MNMDNKTFIYHLKETDNDSLPYGRYFIDKETKKLYVSPVTREKWEALDKRYSSFSNILIPLAVAGVMFYGARIGAIIAQNSKSENILFFLTCVGVIFAFFILIKLRILKPVRVLQKEAGFMLAECEKTDEILFLELVVKYHRKVLAIFISTFVLMFILGYAASVIAPMLSGAIVLVPFLVALIPVIIAAGVSLVLPISVSAIPTVNTRLSILKEEEQK